MKFRSLIAPAMIAGILILSSCGNKLEKDIQPMADAMCKFIEVQNKLQAAIAADDTTAMAQMMKEQKQMQIEMTVLNEEFKQKYGDKISDQEFGKKFSKAMNKALLDCPHLSKEDREMMEKKMGD